MNSSVDQVVARRFSAALLGTKALPSDELEKPWIDASHVSRELRDWISRSLARLACRWFAENGGWISTVGLCNEVPVTGPLWARGDIGELGLRFTSASWEAVCALTGIRNFRRAPAAAPDLLATGDQWLGVVLFDLWHDSPCDSDLGGDRDQQRPTGPALAIRRLWRDNALLWWLDPRAARVGTLSSQVTIAPWLENGGCYLESLGSVCHARWAADSHCLSTDVETTRREWWSEHARLLGAAQREDLALFLLAIADTLPAQLSPDSQACEILRTILSWNRRKQQVRFVDPGYRFTQVWNDAWRRFRGPQREQRLQQLGLNAGS